MSNGSIQRAESGTDEPAPREPASTALILPGRLRAFLAVKGTAHEPAAKPAMKPRARDALNAAIARAADGSKTLRRVG